MTVCQGRTLDGERCTASAMADGSGYCSSHRPSAVPGPEPDVQRLAAESPQDRPNPSDGTDPRLERARALTALLALRDEQVAERRRLIAELRADGWPMAAIAEAIGVSRTRLYAIIGELAQAPET